MAARSLTMACGKCKVEVLKATLITLDLFLENPSLLAVPYLVTSTVAPDVFRTFIDAIHGKPVTVDISNYSELGILCEEFGFHGLDTEIDRHKPGKVSQVDAGLIMRFNYLEKVVEGIKGEIRALWKLNSSVRAFGERIDNNQNDLARELEEVVGRISTESDERKRDIEELKISLGLEYQEEIGMSPVKGIPSNQMKSPKKKKTHEELARDEATKFKNIELDGILGYLRCQCMGNVHEKGVVNITASGTCYSQPYRVADRNWSGCWTSHNEPNSWIMFDFMDMFVCLTHYVVMTLGGCWYPGKWEVTGSNDGCSWIVLDRRDTDVLCQEGGGGSDGKRHCFPCKSDDCYFRYIRVTQTGKRQSKKADWDDQFALSEVEFFGTIQKSD